MKSHRDRHASTNLIEMQEQINIGGCSDNLSDLPLDYLSAV